MDLDIKSLIQAIELQLSDITDVELTKAEKGIKRIIYHYKIKCNLG